MIRMVEAGPKLRLRISIAMIIRGAGVVVAFLLTVVLARSFGAANTGNYFLDNHRDDRRSGCPLGPRRCHGAVDGCVTGSQPRTTRQL